MLLLQTSESRLEDADDSEFLSDEWVSPEEYYKVARVTRSVGRFTKIVYPDLHGSRPCPKKEPLYERKFGVQRSTVVFFVYKAIKFEKY